MMESTFRQKEMPCSVSQPKVKLRPRFSAMTITVLITEPYSENLEDLVGSSFEVLQDSLESCGVSSQIRRFKSREEMILGVSASVILTPEQIKLAEDAYLTLTSEPEATTSRMPCVTELDADYRDLVAMHHVGLVTSCSPTLTPIDERFPFGRFSITWDALKLEAIVTGIRGEG